MEATAPPTLVVEIVAEIVVGNTILSIEAGRLTQTGQPRTNSAVQLAGIPCPTGRQTHAKDNNKEAWVTARQVGVTTGPEIGETIAEPVGTAVETARAQEPTTGTPEIAEVAVEAIA
jgi:hypothetical protein